ncbi:MAG: AbrB/MazE/SpoVT family DNA-binding domain-containing protein [Thermoplasmata archaeon]|nr:AbrB/MazE/SpoVT family DNA-binding domain-containing protein [Thermoplasmata archaeon]
MTEPAFVTRAVRATRRSTSLRVTIPQVIASTLHLKPGDPVSWVLDSGDGSVRIERLARLPVIPAVG